MKVEAVDADVGKVDDVIDSPLGRALVFGRKVLLPAGLVTSIDVDEERIKVSRTKHEIKQAPELETFSRLGRGSC